MWRGTLSPTYIYIRMCTYTWAHFYMYTFTHMRLYLVLIFFWSRNTSDFDVELFHLHIYIRVCSHTWAHLHMYTFTHMRFDCVLIVSLESGMPRIWTSNSFTYIHIYTRVYTYISAFIHVYVYTYLRVLRSDDVFEVWNASDFDVKLFYLQIYIRASTRIWVYLHMYMSRYMFMYCTVMVSFISRMTRILTSNSSICKYIHAYVHI